MNNWSEEKLEQRFSQAAFNAEGCLQVVRSKTRPNSSCKKISDCLLAKLYVFNGLHGTLLKSPEVLIGELERMRRDVPMPVRVYDPSTFARSYVGYLNELIGEFGGNDNPACEYA